MNPDLQRQLVRRVHAHLEARTTDADDAPTTLDVAAYTDEARFAREHAALFRRTPIAVGHVSQLAAPGDFFTHDDSGLPLLVTKREDGRIAAFLNVCRHRGTRLEHAPCGSRRAFVCPYHAWSYALDGALIGVPHERAFDPRGAVSKLSVLRGAGDPGRGLVEVPTAIVAGLVFVCPDGAIPGDWLGPLADDLRGFGLDTSVVCDVEATQRRIVRDLSWKLAIDVFLESYHLRPVHKHSIYGLFFDNLGLVDRVGPHQRNVFPKRTIRELAGTPEDTWQLRQHANVLFHLFPNTLVLVEPDHAAVLHIWPQGPGRTLLASYMLVPEQPTTDKARHYWAANQAILHAAVDEDFAMGESIQRGFAAGANREVVFGAFEHSLAHFHGQISATATAAAAATGGRTEDPQLH